MIEAIQNRRSIRKFSNRPIEDSKISEILEAARLAPSGNNTQPWHFIVVKAPEMRHKLAVASHDQMWMETAPVHIVCIADIRCRIPAEVPVSLDDDSPLLEFKKLIRDTSVGIEHLVLEAVNQGLGSCWIAWFEPMEIAGLLDVPADKYVQAIIPLGYPDENPQPRPRKSIQEFVHYEKW